ncbi:MAG: hypothetical protein DRP74_01970 [Candidatus Omnitrophota bacterium]|nr:MAG: hypothetical protein DRP74_01970 [Candidatus Omnitrophota bacterium]
MLKGENIICISSIDWDFIWQGHQEIMSSFAENGNRVLFIENTGIRTPNLKDFPRIKQRVRNWLKGTKGIRMVKANLYVFSPIILPFPYSTIAAFINRFLLLSVLRRWIQIMDFNDAIIWTFIPNCVSLDIISKISKKAVVYYCIDNFRAATNLNKNLVRAEKKLLQVSDLVFVTSHNLLDYAKKYAKEAYWFPFGVNIDKFSPEKVRNSQMPAELAGLKSPIIGYIGGIHRWIDKDLIKSAATRLNDYNFVFVGPIQTDVTDLEKLQNVKFLGGRSHERLAEYVKFFDLALIPYKLTEYTKNVYPTKLNEYMALGKTVVSTKIFEVEKFNNRYDKVVYVSDNRDDFVLLIEKALREDSEQLRQRRISIAAENDWGHRIKEMSDLIKTTIEKKKYLAQLLWKESLKNLYRLSYKQVMRIGLICLLSYFLFFKTPFIWLLANPLKINEKPQDADAILVFAGGVGESGKAGQGYEERVLFAAEVFKGGYADKVIFSSGYMYAFKEAELMKRLAISIGIPAEAIILEEKAASTYENVKFSKEILNENSLRSVILISSPYHMRRVSLVFNKIAKEITVHYVPIPNCIYYDDSEGVKLRHIRGIIHEYMGIVYYWWKGYI